MAASATLPLLLQLPTRLCLLRYIRGSQAQAAGSAVDLLETYLSETEEGLSHAANLPASQRFFYESKRANREQSLFAFRSHKTHSHHGNVNEGYLSSHFHDANTNYMYNGERCLSPRHNAIQLRLGNAQLLSSTRHAAITNVNQAHPLYFAQTSPRLAGLCVPLIMALRELRIHKLTELQGALIPLMLRGKHVIAHAETGSGKSFGIALAIINRILRDNLNYRLHTVILVPTEELAWQYEKWFCHFGNGTSQIVQVAVDSIPLEQQLAKLHNIAPHVLVGTPARVAEINRLSSSILGETLRRKVDCVVLDEADLILNITMRYGYKEITGKELIDKLFRVHQEEVPAQMVAASATIDGVTARTLNTWTRNDKAVRLTTSFVEHTIPSCISFYFFAAAPLPKYNLLYCLELILRFILHQTNNARVLLFTEDENINQVIEYINNLYVKRDSTTLETTKEMRPLAMALHSYLSPQKCHSLRDINTENDSSPPLTANRHTSSKSAIVARSQHLYINDHSALALFNGGEVTVGVAPHSLGRGLHVNNVTHVILFGEFTPELARSNAFVHCAGRTGRMGKEGDVIVLYPPSSGRIIQQMCSSLEIPFMPHKMRVIEELLPNSLSHSSTEHSSNKFIETHTKNEKRHSASFDEHDSQKYTSTLCNKNNANENIACEKIVTSTSPTFGSVLSLSALDAHNAQLIAMNEAEQIHNFLSDTTL